MSADLRSRIGAAIAEQHRQGALVGAEVDAVMAEIWGTGRVGWAADVSRGYADCVTFIDPPLTPDSQRVLVIPMPEAAA